MSEWTADWSKVGPYWSKVGPLWSKSWSTGTAGTAPSGPRSSVHSPLPEWSTRLTETGEWTG